MSSARYPKTYGNGHYSRTAGGAWVYTATGELVPGAVDLRVRGRWVMWAPELHPENLLPAARAAECVGMKPGSFRRMLTRGCGPEPVAHVGWSPVWTRGVLEAWQRARAARED